tara:strand:- start:683 stop:979 length:297 start_codon:yes stop_codon:yes gene_type:complete
MDKETIQKFAEQVAEEVSLLQEAKKEITKIRDDLMSASYSETQACKKIAEAFDIDFRTLQKWLSNKRSAKLNSKNRLQVVLFIDSYKEFQKEIQKGES